MPELKNVLFKKKKKKQETENVYQTFGGFKKSKNKIGKRKMTW